MEGTPYAGWCLEDGSGDTMPCFLLLRNAGRFPWVLVGELVPAASSGSAFWRLTMLTTMFG
ncbi:hypothetical protein SLEP1_g52976 [Rubroshorea leprosula]|uniref:Uncharacterized protein n=1 Tax=Rubroshorea leprosula TaxID=152421 RepID=A0AAV5MBF2_9ROSI|nr:hypothetical protein SLEP1_g52976 [Rubroshorea leprosula]